MREPLNPPGSGCGPDPEAAPDRPDEPSDGTDDDAGPDPDERDPYQPL